MAKLTRYLIIIAGCRGLEKDGLDETNAIARISNSNFSLSPSNIDKGAFYHV